MAPHPDTHLSSYGASETATEKAQTQPQESRDVERQGNNQSPSSCSEESYEVTWNGEDDPQDPRNLSPGRKWMCVVVVAFSSFCVTNNSAIYTTTYDQIMPLFQTTRLVATLGLSTFVFGLMLGPMILAPLSEFYGRRLVYIGSYAMVFVWIIPCAVAQNIQTILVTRFFDGFFGSVFLSVAGGTIGDMFNKNELSWPMMIYSGSPFMGPALAPVIGGFINQYTNWRWTFWVLLIWTGTQLGLITLFVPETYHPVLLRRKAQKMRRDTRDDKWQAPIEKTTRSIPETVLWSCIRPFQLLFFEPTVLCLCLLSALVLGVLYLFFGAFPLVFQTNHGFSLSQSGMSFLGLFVGMVIGILSDLIWQRNYARLQARAKTDETQPEWRLPPTVFGAWMLVVGLFGFAWTSFKHVHWIVPIFFSGFYGLGTITVFAGVFTFLVESYPLYAASALAANSFARSLLAACLPLAATSMYNGIGFQWATTALAFASLLLAPFPYIFYRHGEWIRSRSRYATSRDTKK